MRLELEMAAVAMAIALPVTYVIRFRTKPGRGPSPVLTPRIGGFSIVAGFLLAPFILALFSGSVRHTLGNDWGQFLALGLCGGVVFLAGARDDFRDLSWQVRMAIQTGAAIALYIAGYRVGEMTLPGGDTITLGIFDPALTVVWLVLATNAMNLIDGHDGVAAGISALVSATMAFVAWDLGHDLISLLFASLAGASLGFVPLNLPTARRFLGDSGAYFLGFTIGGLSIAGFVDTTGRVPLYIPLVALGLPVLDAGLAFVRRYLDARHPFEADFDHMHDRLERTLGLKPLHVTLAAYGITAVFCGAALLLHAWYKNVGSAVVGAAVVLFAAGLLASLGYIGTMWNSARVASIRGRRDDARQRV